MLTENGVKQEISFVYLHALTARLGYSLERICIDMDSIDAMICAKRIPGTALTSPRIEVQLKATMQECPGLSTTFPLSKKNYDDLRRETLIPRVLIVLFLPLNLQSIIWDEEKIAIYGKAYWTNLRGKETTENRSTISISLSERITDQTVQEWMIAVANREELGYAARK